jgi:hypothetical protein
MSRTIKWVLIVSAITLALSTIISLSSQDLKAKEASASPGISSALAPSSAVATCVTPARPNESVQYGRVKSLTRKGRSFEMRVDPAVWLSGVTARRLALEDSPGDPGGDYYILDEGHRLVTYLVPPTARLRVITSISQGIRYTRVTASQLAQIVKGKSQKLGRYRHYGFSIRLCQGAGLATDTVRSLDQVYQP